jgi:prepilin-type N-terminal cleavage/methylation domain-containing protein/prepilin-type processing-associated H-X9-DG protein
MRATVKTSRLAFTLIELLVVIGIIAILAGLLLPALARAKNASRKVICINNVKQMAVSWVMYATDHNDLLMPNGGYNTGWGTQLKIWCQGSFVNVDDYTNFNYIINTDYALMANYIKTIPTFHCPTDRELVKIGTQYYARLRSYELNAYTGWTGNWDTRMSANYFVFRKSTEINIKVPAGMVFTFQDVNPDSICWPYFGMHMDYDSFFNYPNASHNRGGVVAFADGHVEYHKWVDSRTFNPAPTVSWHTHQESSSGNQDLVWLRARTTFPINSSFYPRQ